MDPRDQRPRPRLPPRPSRPSLPWGRDGKPPAPDSRISEQAIEFQTTLRENKSLREERGLLRHQLRHQLNENKKLADATARENGLRDEVKDLQETVNSIMSFIFVAVTDLRTRSRIRRAHNAMGKEQSSEGETAGEEAWPDADICIGLDGGSFPPDSSAMI